MSTTTVTTPDGATLSVLVRDPPRGLRPGLLPLVFLHGNSCDHGFLAPQIDHFSTTRRVVAPDLRGHGKSDKPAGPYAFPCLADDVAFLCRTLELGPAVVVGHSMGGMVALEFCRRHRPQVAGVACLDTTVLPPPGRPSRFAALLDGLRSENWQPYFLRYFESAFEPCDDPALKARILERMLGTPRHVVISLFEQWRVADGAQAAAACEVPLLYVTSARPRTDLEQLRRICPQLMTGQVVGAGHFFPLEVPDQVNAMLERFLAVSGL